MHVSGDFPPQQVKGEDTRRVTRVWPRRVTVPMRRRGSDPSTVPRAVLGAKAGRGAGREGFQSETKGLLPSNSFMICNMCYVKIEVM